MIKITILGCGPSLGVPVIACECLVCNSKLPYNKRTRSAILIQNDSTDILVDFGFEIREQLLRAGVKKLDAAILTHDHADHVQGIDNLRVFPFIQQKPLNIYTDVKTAEAIETRYQYLFNGSLLNTQVIKFEDEAIIGSLKIQFFRQHHGPVIDSLGIKIENFVYANDVSNFPPESEKFLYGLKTLVIDCRAYTSNSHHLGLETVLQLNDKYKPQEMLLTNLGHEIDYEDISLKLPKNVKPLYDGYEITFY